MTDERQDEMAALEAFDLLEGAEKAQFEGEMARNPELRQRVQQLREAAARMAHAAPAAEPPAALKERILASAAHHRQAAAPEPARVAKILPFPVIVAWAAAACCAVLAGGMTQLYFAARQHASVLQEQGQLADLELKSLQTRFDAERLVNERKLTEAETASNLAQMRIAALTSLLGNSPEAVAVAVWNPARQEGVLAVDKLPVAAANQDYELWMIPPGAQPVAAGLIKVGALGHSRVLFHADKPVDAVAKFAVTLERKGGVPAPAGTMVLLSQ